MLKGAASNETPEMQGAIANEVNSRMENAAQELAAKYAAGKGGEDYSETGPTGAAYKEKNANEALKKKDEMIRRAAVEEQENSKRTENLDSDDDEEDGDADHEVRRLRTARLKQMKQDSRERMENLGKGHGQYRNVVQDEFLAEVTSSERVVVHFYHQDFERCKVMDMHLAKLAARHVETKFIKIDADKAPFFVEKLHIRMMPTLVQFIDGVARGKQVGFEGLADQMPDDKADEWPTIYLARILAKNTMINKEAVVDDDGVEAAAKAKLDAMRKQAYVGMPSSVFEMDEDDLDMDNI
jgi:thioredoxin-like negative regulator of GroEL